MFRLAEFHTTPVIGRRFRHRRLFLPVLTAALFGLAPLAAAQNLEIVPRPPAPDTQVQRQPPRTVHTGPKLVLDPHRAQLAARRAQAANQPNRANRDEAPDPDTLFAQGQTEDGNAAKACKDGKGDGKTTTANGANNGGGKAGDKTATADAANDGDGNAENQADPPKPAKPKVLRSNNPETFIDADGNVREYLRPRFDESTGEQLLVELGETGPGGGFPPPWYIEEYIQDMLKSFASGEFVVKRGGRVKRIPGLDLCIDFYKEWRAADTVDEKLRVVRSFISAYELAAEQLKQKNILEAPPTGRDTVPETLDKLHWLDRNIADPSGESVIDDLAPYNPGA